MEFAANRNNKTTSAFAYWQICKAAGLKRMKSVNGKPVLSAGEKRLVEIHLEEKESDKRHMERRMKQIRKDGFR